MDIYAGSGICIGKNNFFTKFYQSAPIGITVEGSNTLTRSLIIFGQGINKSHPFIFPIYESITSNNLFQFQTYFNKLLIHLLSNYAKIMKKPKNRLDRLTWKFHLLSTFLCLLGGQIKSKQMISGTMTDILSNIYLAYSVEWYMHHNFTNSPYKLEIQEYFINRLCEESESKVNTIIHNFPISYIKMILYPLLYKSQSVDFAQMKTMITIIMNDTDFINHLKEEKHSNI
jgi:acyl-CoA dehydrogenase